MFGQPRVVNDVQGYLADLDHPERYTHVSPIPSNEYRTFWNSAEMHDGQTDMQDFGYQVNNYGYRSDNFEKMPDLSDSHVLFAGCSLTFGFGLPYKQNWAGLLWKELFSNQNKFLCLGAVGASVDYVVDRIYDYINNFGVPKTVFALMPSAYRKTLKDDIVAVPNIKFCWGEDNYQEEAYQIIKELGSFLDSLGAKLIWSTWDYADTEYFKSKPHIGGYFEINPDEINKIMDPVVKETEKYYHIARDNAHPGIGYNSSVAKMFKKKYDETKN